LRRGKLLLARTGPASPSGPENEVDLAQKAYRGKSRSGRSKEWQRAGRAAGRQRVQVSEAHDPNQPGRIGELQTTLERVFSLAAGKGRAGEFGLGVFTTRKH